MSDETKRIPPEVPHYFHSHKQWDSVNQLGMWLFLATEVLFFGGIFAGFILLKGKFPDAFAAGHNELSVFYGGLNTIVLLASSLTVALAIQASDSCNKERIVKLLWWTIGLAGVFLVIKTIEYTGKYNSCLMPGEFFGFPAPDAEGIMRMAEHCMEGHGGHLAAGQLPAESSIFFSLYFIMTGIHGIHVIIGMFLMYWVIRQARRNHFGPEYKGALENVGLYWHLVDLIWIFLFPTLYRVG